MCLLTRTIFKATEAFAKCNYQSAHAYTHTHTHISYNTLTSEYWMDDFLRKIVTIAISEQYYVSGTSIYNQRSKLQATNVAQKNRMLE